MASLGVIVLSALLRPFDAPDLPAGHYYRVLPVTSTGMLTVQVRRGSISLPLDSDPVVTSSSRSLMWNPEDAAYSARGVVGALAMDAGTDAVMLLQQTGRMISAGSYTGVYA